MSKQDWGSMERNEDLRCRVIEEIARIKDIDFREAEAIHDRNIKITRLLRLDSKLDRIIRGIC